ncbi:(2Fe-2S)-binding protein [candidate division WOR-3 bacterium]|nr:(2Fe-2S)-binding protein [candidate division WOR-3 bacterium]MCK4526916.1 (2Fe-2S)-binding protein [candidate division WOR-3 bacterium]
MRIEFTLNSESVSIDTEPQRRLLDILREDFRLISVKEGCGEGECGACIILLDGKAVNSCLIPAGRIKGSEVITLEGYRETERFRILMESFEDAGAVQCGFCTPGIIMTVESLLRENSNPTEEEIKKALSGNLCRCTGYSMIVDGVVRAVKKVKNDGKSI